MKQVVLTILGILLVGSAFSQVCNSWGDGTDSIKNRRYYEEYRKLLSSYHYQDAVFFWNYIYKKAPSATKNIYLDGIKMYKHFYNNESSNDKKKEYADKIVEIYNQRAACFPDDISNILARKAIELYWLEVEIMETFTAFNEALEKGGDNTPAFAIVPCAKVIAQAFLEGKITEEEKQAAIQKMNKVALNNIDLDNDTENYYGALMNAKYVIKNAEQTYEKRALLAENDQNQGMSDCQKIAVAYRNKINASPDNDMLITKAINELRQLDCEEAKSYQTTLLALQDEQLRKQIEGSAIAARSGNIIASANFAFKNGDFEKAVELYEDAIQETNDFAQKAAYHLQIAKILYAKLDKKADAKSHIEQVLTYEPNNGDAYILLGDLYVAGAKECFPKDLFSQKMVLFAAIDQWKKAKSVDDTVGQKADERIEKYSKYVPTRSELFLARSRFKGRTYQIGCWIDEKVKTPKFK